MNQFHLFYFEGSKLVDGETIASRDLLEAIDRAHQDRGDLRVEIRAANGWTGSMGLPPMHDAIDDDRDRRRI
ncbi:hypothetical protein WJS89_07505 [Sphingomicrobium sp. XHP0235]|uniref:hypothetical protein n=1 Tax=Sphingomicrobium aquimarinum TaxID=3133971 RepID=UPI0031FEE3C3